MTDEMIDAAVKLKTSGELGVDTDRLRDWVRRGLCRPTAYTPQGAYLWGPAEIAAVYRAQEYVAQQERARLAYRAIREKQTTAIDWAREHTGPGVLVSGAPPEGT